MKLYYSPGASSLAVHIAVCEADSRAHLGHVELVRVDLETGLIPATGEAFAALHPMAKVPALELEDGSLLSETLAILQYVADRAQAAGLSPVTNDGARYRMIEAMSFIATELHKGFSPLFDPHAPAVYKQHLLSDSRPFTKLAELVAAGPWVLGDRFSIADAHLFTILRLGRHAGLDFSPWPAVERFLEQAAQRPSVREAMRAEGLIEA